MNQKIKTFLTRVGIGAGAVAASVPFASATALIENDTLQGMPQMGTDIGSFLGNLAPGLFKFLLLVGVGTAIVGIIVAIIFVVKSKATKFVR